MYQKNRKNLLAHVRAFTTVSTKHTAASHNSRKTILRANHTNNVDKGSSTLLIRGLTFETEQQTSAKTDVLSVQAVPSNFVSISKPSEVVEKLITKRKIAHENSLEEMRLELTDVHEECENEIRERSTQIKIEIHNILENIEKAQRRIQETDILRVTDKILRSTWESIKHLVADEKKSIDEFNDCLRAVEHTRRSRVKGVMQKYYEIFHSISHMLSFEIQSFLESEIQDYNETVLMNFKVYENLHLNMSIEVDNRNKELETWLEEMKKRKRDALASENFEQLIRKRERLEQAGEFILYDYVGQLALKELSFKLSELQEAVSNWASTIVIFDEISVNDCVEQLHDAVTELNISGTKLVESYKSSLQNMSDQYEKEVEIFKADNKKGFWKEDMDRLDKAVRSLRDFYQSITVKLEDLWSEHSNAIEDSVEGISSFLQDFNSIWKKQASRLVELQETTALFVDDLTAKSEKSIVDLEKKVTTHSQQLREATNEEKMKQHLAQISSTLDLICEKYKLTYNEECKTIEKYIENVLNEVPSIIEQFNKFIGSYDENIGENDEEDFITDLSDSSPGFISQQLNTCRNLVSNILYWKSMLLAKIIAFSESFTEETRETAQEWQEMIFSQRSAVLQTKLDADSERRKDIKINIYDVRVQEIEDHLKKLEDHKEEVNQVLQDTSNRLDEFLQEQKQSLQKFESEIIQATDRIPAGRSTIAVHRLQKEIDKLREDYKTEAEKKTVVHKQQLENILQRLSDKNDNFLNEIKIFKDGGNFSMEEAKFYRQSLTVCTKIIYKSGMINVQKIHKASDELSKTIEKSYKTIVDSINTTTRELKFYEDAQKMLTKCAVIIERQVYRLLEDDTRFINAVVNNIQDSTKELCKHSNVQIFVDQSIQIFQSMGSRLDNLMIGFPISNVNSSELDQVKPRKISKGNQRKRQKSVQKGTNYRNLFLGSADNPTKENCFSTTTMNTMLKTIDQIQAAATAFFSPTPKRHDSEACYRDYMQQILHQMHCYREQLENLWRQEVQEILATVEAFEKSSFDCILSSLNDFNEIRISEIIATKETISRELNKTVKNNFNRRDKMYESLKVSYGHPKKKDSLAKLTTEVMEEEDGMQKAITDDLIEYEKKLRGLVNLYEVALQNEGNLLRKILTKIEDRGKKLRLRNLLNERNRSGHPDLTTISYRLDLPEKANRRSVMYTQNSESAQLINYSIESVLNQLIENTREIYISAAEEWQNAANDFLQAGEEFKQNWRRNIEIVAEVYEAIL